VNFGLEETANYLGLFPETVSHQISLLRKRKIIELLSPREVWGPNVQGLIEAANAEAWFMPAN
jgi:hypothetical protein